MPEKLAEKRILIVGGDLDGLGIPKEKLEIVLRELRKLVAEGEIRDISEAREKVPIIDTSKFQEQKPPSNKQETHWQLKKQGKR